MFRLNEAQGITIRQNFLEKNKSRFLRFFFPYKNAYLELQLNPELVKSVETVEKDGIPNRAVILDVEIEECAEHSL